MFAHQLVGLAHFEDCHNTPVPLPTRCPEVQTEPKLTKILLSLAVQLVLQFHVFRICAEWIFHGSNSAHRQLCEENSRDLSM